MVRKFTHWQAMLLLYAIIGLSGTLKAQDCNCDVTITPSQHVFDGSGVSPGSTICLGSGTRNGTLRIRDLNGAPGQEILIINCGGQLNINVDTSLSFGIWFTNCHYFRITGKDGGGTHGIVIDGGKQGLTIGDYSSNFEVDHLEIRNSGFAGIMAKTDNSGRGSYVMRNVKFHHNYIYNPEGEGFYIGNTSWQVNGNQHDIDTLELYENTTENTGREGIQVGCTYSGNAKIYNNTVINAGLENITFQTSGVQLGNGFSGSFYNNYIENPAEGGISVLGVGNINVFNNVIKNPGNLAIYSGYQTAEPGKEFNYIHNTILMGSTTGPVIRFDPDTSCTARIYNNAIVKPQTGTTFDQLSGTMDVDGNVVSTDISDFNFEDPSSGNYDILTGSQAIGAGTNVNAYNIDWDFEYRNRPAGNYDAGAYEYQPASVLYRVNAGGQAVSDTPIGWEKDKQSDTCEWVNASVSNYTTGSDLPWSGTNNTSAPSQIFSTRRYASFGKTEVSYSFPVSNGTYELQLYFAENDYQSAGQRVFDVAAEGNTVLNDFDIYANAQYMNAFDTAFNVTVNDGILDVAFIAETGNPQINGIVIVSSGSGSASRLVTTNYRPRESAAGNISAYPIPATDMLYVQETTGGLRNNKTGPVKVRLLSATGVVLYQAMHRFTGGVMNPVRLTPLALPRGVYFLELSGNRTNKILRVMKK